MLINVVEIELKKKYDIDIQGDNSYVYGIETAKNIFINELSKCNIEKIGAIFVDSTNRIINYATIALGEINSVRLPLAELFKIALLSNASKFIICHNHPSGVLAVSNSDIELTKKIGAIAKLFDMSLIDSIIINISGEIISIRESIKEHEF